MIRASALITGMAAAAAFGTAAHAADPPRTWTPAYERPAPRYVEMASGWYVRGDFGYRFNHVDSVQAGRPVTSFKYPDSLGVSAGGGYKYQWFRFDATVDYAPRVTARAASTFATAQPQYTTKLDALSILANVYLDLGTWGGFTPYVGAGAGVTYLRSRDYEDKALPINHAMANGRTNFSWAGMAGDAYQISPRWVVDVGYRYLSLGDLPTTTGTGLAIDNTTWKHLSTQEVRIGFRFLLD
jgi:opacity protein-like surface antigen